MSAVRRGGARLTWLVVLLAWFAVGAVVALRAVPWRDVSFHAPWARMRADGGPPSSWAADVAFFVLTAAVWPVAWRWRALGAFDARDDANGTPPLQDSGGSGHPRSVRRPLDSGGAGPA